MINETTIWNSFRNGDWEAFAQLYNYHYTLLTNYGFKFTHDINVIEDSIHDLFVKLWQNKHNLGSTTSVRNYLFKSLRGILFRKLDLEKKFSRFPAEEFAFSFEISYDEQLILKEHEKEVKDKLLELLNTLSNRQREIIYLRFYEGMSYEEIADVMSISISSTYKLLYKALDGLRHSLGNAHIQMLLYLCCTKCF